MAEEKSLPGWPTKKLVREVKSVLWRYVRSRPQVTDRLWCMTWEWASLIERRNGLFDFSRRRRRRWPAAHEIASQFLFLSLMEMRSSCNLQLPFRANEQVPHTVVECMQTAAKLEAVKTGASGIGFLKIEFHPENHPDANEPSSQSRTAQLESVAMHGDQQPVPEVGPRRSLRASQYTADG